MFITKLVVEELDDAANDERGLWQVMEALKYESKGLGTFVVPIGFQTDFASVPRIPIAWLLCGDTAHPAAVLHDYLYTYHPTGPGKAGRALADNLLREAALSEKVPAWRAWMLWAGVRIGGASHWGA
jgi:hypothetical protein